MSLIQLVICILAIAMIASVPMCNYSTVDTSDPATVQLAQLEAIKCLILTNEVQNEKVLDTIRNITSADTHSSSSSLLSIVCYSIGSITVMYILSLTVRSIWYIILLKNDNVADTMNELRRCRNIVSGDDGAHMTRDDYRKQASRPWPVTCLQCCGLCNAHTRRDELTLQQL